MAITVNAGQLTSSLKSLFSGKPPTTSPAVKPKLGARADTGKQKAMHGIDRFLAEVKDKGVAESDRFEVYISAPKCLNKAAQFDLTQRAMIYADSVAFPPLSLYVKQCRIFGPAQQRPISSDYGGDGMSISFLLDRDMEIKKMFDYWMGCIVGHDDHLVSYQDEYVCELEIYQLDRQNNVTYSAKMTGAFPRSMMQLDMNHANAGQHHRLLISFAYHKWSVGQVKR